MEKSYSAVYKCQSGNIQLEISSNEQKGILRRKQNENLHNTKSVSFFAKSLQRYISRDKNYDTFCDVNDDNKKQDGGYAERARNFFKTFPKPSTVDEEEDAIPLDEDLGKGFLLICLTDILFSLAVIASQMTSSVQAVYDLNILRLTLQMLLSLVLAYIWGAPILMNCGHAVLCVCIVLFNCVFQAMYFRSTAYLPVGDMVGLSAGLVIILAALIDGCFQKLSWATVASTLICCPGIILLIQPWTSGTDTPVPIVSPCKLIGQPDQLRHRTTNNITTWGIPSPDEQPLIATQSSNITTWGIPSSDKQPLITAQLSNITTWGIFTTAPLQFTSVYNNSTGLDFDQVSSLQEFFIFLNPVIGYIMTTVAAVSFVINAKISKYLVSMYHPLSIACWVNSLMFFISLMTSFDADTFTFPAMNNYFSNGWLCTFFRLLFIIGSASYQITYQCSLSFLQVSQAAVGEALSVVILFICQVTVLTEVHPTTNTCLKGVGVCFTFIGAIIAPLKKITKRYWKSTSVH